jgi:hypothetical protein
VPVKRKIEISQNFAAFSEYMNFNARISASEKDLPVVVLVPEV